MFVSILFVGHISGRSLELDSAGSCMGAGGIMCINCLLHLTLIEGYYIPPYWFSE